MRGTFRNIRQGGNFPANERTGGARRSYLMAPPPLLLYQIHNHRRSVGRGEERMLVDTWKRGGGRVKAEQTVCGGGGNRVWFYQSLKQMLKDIQEIWL